MKATDDLRDRLARDNATSDRLRQALQARGARMTDTVTVYQDQAGEWRWTRKAGNGEKVADSGEGYVDRSHAVEMATTLFPGVEVVVDE